MLSVSLDGAAVNAYPHAIEDDGQLFIAYAIAKEDCGLSIIPVSCLAAESKR